MAEPNPHRVIIIGAGFGGLWAAKQFAGKPVLVTVIDRTNHHLFQPLLYQVATAGLAAPSIAAPIRHVLRKQKNVTVLLGEVTDIDVQSKAVVLSDGVQLEYDHLIVAAGATHSYFGKDAWEQHAPGLKTLQDAQRIRKQILNAFEQAERESDDIKRAELLRFVVIGGGPTGVEMAGTLAEIARHTLAGQFRRFDARSAEIILLEGGERILNAYPADLSMKAAQQLTDLGVKVELNAKVSDIDASGVRFDRAEQTHRIDARTVIWGAGVKASPLGTVLAKRIPNLPLDRAGRVNVLPDLTVTDHPEISVIGDLASISVDGNPVPGIAPAAKQMGAHAASNILRAIYGKTLTAFTYKDYGSMATIGRHRAIAMLFGQKFSGLFAWWLWLVVHILFLIGFRNRAVVLLDWAGQYWSMQRHARIF
jgi:NADH:ubiquinone reductase (H+-translocating)